MTLSRFSWMVSALNFVLFHYPFFKFVFGNLDYKSFTGISIIVSLVILMLVANYFVVNLFLFLSKYFGKFLMVLFFLISSVAVYFVNTYSVIIDESMIGNVFNTQYSEASSFFSVQLILYVLFLGVLPSLFIIKAKIIKEKPKKFLVRSGLTLLFMAVMVFANASNWLWIDKNSKTLGGLAMPWSYSVNTA